jgi:uncharacterized protein
MLALVALPVLPASALPPRPARYVVDDAWVLDDAREEALNEELAEYESRTTNHFVVYVGRKVPEGTTLEEMSAEALRVWGIGQPGRNNGAILFLFVEGRQGRLELGYDLRGTITEALANRIVTGLQPAMEQGDYTTAAEEGIHELQAMLDNPLAAYDADQAATVVDEQEQRRLALNAGSVVRFGIAPLVLFALFVVAVILVVRRRARRKLLVP